MDQQQQNKNKNVYSYSTILRPTDCKTNCSPSHNSGFALVLGLCLMPLILGAIIASMAIVWFLNTKNELLFQCEKELLKTQQTLVHAENKLLLLNPSIKALVAQKKILQKALRAAKSPPLFAAIKAQLIQIEIQLLSLKKQQLILVKTTHAQSHLEISLLTQKFRRRLLHLQEQWSVRLRTLLQVPKPLIRLHAQRIDPSAIIYLVPIDFSAQQTLTFQWALKGSSLFPSWLTLIYDHHFSWQDSCSSRPHKKELKPWTAEIGKGRL